MENKIIVYRADGIAVEVPLDPARVADPDFASAIGEAIHTVLTLEITRPDAAAVDE